MFSPPGKECIGCYNILALKEGVNIWRYDILTLKEWVGSVDILCCNIVTPKERVNIWYYNIFTPGKGGENSIS